MQRAAGLWAVVVIMTFGRLTPTRQLIPAFTHFAGLPNFGNVKRIDILNAKMYSHSPLFKNILFVLMRVHLVFSTTLFPVGNKCLQMSKCQVSPVSEERAQTLNTDHDQPSPVSGPDGSGVWKICYKMPSSSHYYHSSQPLRRNNNQP